MFYSGRIGLVEVAMRNTAWHAHEIAGLGPDAIQLQVEFAVEHQDELVLCGMDMHGHVLTGIAVRLEREGRVAGRLREVALTEDVPGFTLVASPARVMPSSMSPIVTLLLRIAFTTRGSLGVASKSLVQPRDGRVAAEG